MDLRAEISSEWKAFEDLQLSTLASGISLLDKINDYLLSHSGKKLRPLLALASAKACSGSVNEKVLVCATASEMIHTATLLHDDVVDESELRRGSLTVRSLFSPGTSLLMGDYWLSKAVNLMVEKRCEHSILECFSLTLADLASGEILQMEHASKLDTGFDDYYEIIRCKTASLFVAAVKSAAIAAGASSEQLEALSAFALELGLCFQMRDDLLDYSTSEETGKDVDCDISERKITLPLLCALESCCAEERSRVLALMNTIEPGADNRKAVEAVKAFVLEKKGVEKASEILSARIERCVAHLAPIQDSPSKKILEAVAQKLRF